MKPRQSTLSSVTPKKKEEKFGVKNNDINCNIEYKNIEALTTNLFNFDISKNFVKINTQITDESNLAFTPYSPELGPPGNNSICINCGIIGCDGHYGFIDFSSVYGKGKIMVCNPIFMRKIYSLLKIICWNCSRLLITTTDIKNNIKFKKLSGVALIKALETYLSSTKKNDTKNFCKSCGTASIIKNTGKDASENGVIKIINKNQNNEDEVGTLTGNEIYEIFNKISAETCQLLNIDYEKSHPKNLIMKGLVVIPNRDRPVITTSKKIHHFITEMYNDILKILSSYKSDKKINSIQMIESDIYKKIKNAIDGKSFNNSTIVKQYFKSLIQSKKGIFRNDTQGARTNSVGRAVIGPGNDIEFNEINIPSVWIELLAIPIKVRDFNLKYFKNLILDSGDDSKVTFILKKGKSYRTLIKDSNRNEISDNLVIGDTIFRNAKEGDIVMAGRQPTLHKGSITAFKVIPWNQKTIGLHLSITPAMNADFDGDESQVYSIQNLFALAEAFVLMRGSSILINNANGKPNMGLVMNSILGSYYLSTSESINSDLLIKHLAKGIKYNYQLKDLDQRLYQFKVDYRKGKGLLSTLFPPDFNYVKGNVVIINGVLIKGTLTKSDVGAVGGSMMQYFWKYYSPEAVRRFITISSLFINDWLGIKKGATIGYSDFFNYDSNGVDKNQEAVQKEKLDLESSLHLISSMPYNSEIAKEEINIAVSEKLNIVESLGNKLVDEILTKDNNFTGPIKSGAKGSSTNLSQIFGIIGRQYKKGAPMRSVLDEGRIDVCFSNGDTNAESLGFISSNFLNGLKPHELFDLSNSGRENIINTSIQTAKAGSMTHLLERMGQNTTIAPNGSVKNGEILLGNFYGYDPSEMIDLKNFGEMKGPFDPKDLILQLNIEAGWFNEDIDVKLDDIPESDKFYTSKNDFEISGEVSKKFLPELEFTKELEDQYYPFLTKFEEAKVLGTRATEISKGANLFIKLNENDDKTNYLEMARKELMQGFLKDYYIIRYIGTEEFKIYATKANLTLNYGYLE